MKNLFTLNYWFNFNPPQLTFLAQVILIVLLFLLIILGLVFVVLKKRKKSYKILFSNLYSFCFTNFFIGLILFFFNYQRISFFSARFWLLVWLIFMIFYLKSILKKFKNNLKGRADRKKQEEFKKYLP